MKTPGVRHFILTHVGGRLYPPLSQGIATLKIIWGDPGSGKPGSTLTFYPTTHKGHGSTKSQGHRGYIGPNAPTTMHSYTTYRYSMGRPPHPTLDYAGSEGYFGGLTQQLRGSPLPPATTNFRVSLPIEYL